MDLKKAKSIPKSLNKSQSVKSIKRKSKQHSKKKQSKSKVNVSNINTQTLKKQQSKVLTKKKIDSLKSPELLIKINYKSKRISIPIYQFDEKNLKEIVIPHIVKFQKEILRNNQFKSFLIQNFKTIGPSASILKDYYFQTGKPLNLFQGESIDIQPIWKSPTNYPLSLKDFDLIKCIGTGGFSRVFLVRLKASGKFYALKLMEKQGLFESGKECVVTNERDIMVDLDHPQILKLQFAFETKHFVALGLQYCPGGELFYYLRKVKRMTEDEARYCFIEILLGIQYLHSKKIIYRDIKPENIMIDMNGNLKIADFGLSKIGLKPHQLAYTYCGSPQYMAPQMLAKSGHSFTVDYYCMGALLYELVTGNPPFYSRNVQKIYYSIQNQDIQFPLHVELSNQIKMLLEGLLVKDPRRRLGSLGGIRQILGHPWVRKLKPADIQGNEIETPIKIDLLSFNINEEEVDENQEQFMQKLQDEDNNFKPLFQDFDFFRNEPFNILDDALPSVKSDSTKQNKSLTVKLRPQKLSKSSKTKQSKQKLQKYQERFTEDNNNKAHYKTDSKNTVKLQKKTKKQPYLVQRSKKRDIRQKSINKFQKKLKSPNKKNTLKRVKSSTALLQNRSINKYK